MVGTKTHKTVTIERRGAFGDDPFFKDSWEEWDQAMKNVVDRWDNQPTTTTTTTTTHGPASTETKSTYRQIRSSNVTSDDSQAVSTTEEDDKYKIMIDVKDVKPEDINLKTVDDTVVVEGKIEKKEGNAVSTQMFTRRFMLPSNVELNSISSALSRDGVLTISAPKKANQGATGRLTAPPSSSRNGTTIFTRTNKDSSGDDKRNLKHTPLYGTHQPEASNNAKTTTTVVRTELAPGAKDHWTSFNDMVEKSQREMEDMMRRHSLNTSLEAPTSPPSISNNLVVHKTPAYAQPPAGLSTSRDVIRQGNNVTEREEKKWDDTLAPGVVRHNRMLNENTDIKGADGSVVGNKQRREQESHAEGSREETLPDGTKRTTFTKNYETSKVYKFNSSDPKAV